MKPIAVWIAILLVGIAIGRLLPRGADEATKESGKSSSAQRASALRNRAGDSEDKTAGKGQAGGNVNRSSAPIAPESGEEMVLVPSTLIGELSRAAGIRTMNQRLFSSDTRIEEALGITEREKAEVQTAWEKKRQKIRDLEASSMKSEEIDEWSVRITVPDLSQSMGSLENEFRTAVHRALGENRSEAFLAAKQVDGTFSPPAEDRSYTVTTESIGDGRWRYRMTLEGPDGTRVWVGENIPDEIRHLTDAAGIQPALEP